MSVWKTEKHDVAFSIYKSFDVRSHPDKQKGLVFFLQQITASKRGVYNKYLCKQYDCFAEL